MGMLEKGEGFCTNNFDSSNVCKHHLIIDFSLHWGSGEEEMKSRKQKSMSSL